MNNPEIRLLFGVAILLISCISFSEFVQGEGRRDWAIERVTGAEVGQ